MTELLTPSGQDPTLVQADNLDKTKEIPNLGLEEISQAEMDEIGIQIEEGITEVQVEPTENDEGHPWLDREDSLSTEFATDISFRKTYSQEAEGKVISTWEADEALRIVDLTLGNDALKQEAKGILQDEDRRTSIRRGLLIALKEGYPKGPIETDERLPGTYRYTDPETQDEVYFMTDTDEADKVERITVIAVGEKGLDSRLFDALGLEEPTDVSEAETDESKDEEEKEPTLDEELHIKERKIEKVTLSETEYSWLRHDNGLEVDAELLIPESDTDPEIYFIDLTVQGKSVDEREDRRVRNMDRKKYKILDKEMLKRAYKSLKQGEATIEGRKIHQGTRKPYEHANRTMRIYFERTNINGKPAIVKIGSSGKQGAEQDAFLKRLPARKK